MSVNTARMLNRIFSAPAWKLLLAAGLLAFIACFIIKGKKKAIPVIICIVSVCLYIVTAGIHGYAEHLISVQAGPVPVKVNDGGEVYKDGVFFAEYDGDSTEGSETFEAFLNDPGAGDTEDLKETEEADDWKETGSYYKEPDKEDIILDESTGDRYVKNQLIIGVTPDTDESVMENLADSYDAEIVGYLTEMKMYQIEFRRDVSYTELEKMIENLESCPYITYAMLNYVDDLKSY